MTVNEKITRVRESLGLNQTQFAKLIGVSKQTISAWEKQGTSVPYQKQLYIAEKLNVNPSVIFGDEVFGNDTDDELIDKIKESYNKLSPEKKIEVLKLIVGQ